MFVFIIAALLSDGTLHLGHHVLPACPPLQIVEEALQAKVETGEVVQYNRSCTRIEVPAQ